MKGGAATTRGGAGCPRGVALTTQLYSAKTQSPVVRDVLRTHVYMGGRVWMG